MNEIEKLYENAKIKKQYCGWLDMGDLDCQMQYVRCNSINEYKEAVFSSRFGETEEEPELKYPEFTAEKQLKIVKFLLNKSVYYDTDGDREYWFHLSDEIENSKYREFDEAIAECINNMWEELRDYEKEQIKDILK